MFAAYYPNYSIKTNESLFFYFLSYYTCMCFLSNYTQPNKLNNNCIV